MKIIVLREHLKLGLDLVSRTISETSHLPILRTILLKTSNSKIFLSGTNLEIAITSAISGKIIENGEIAVPFSTFSSIINNLDSERINLSKKNKTIEIKTDNYSAVIQGMDSADFPIIPDIENKKSYIDIDSVILKESIGKVVSAAQNSDFRPELNGILFDFQGAVIKLVATDSFRLAEKTISPPQFTPHTISEFSVIIPLKTTQELLRSLKDGSQVKIFYDKNQILFSTNEFEMISRLVDGKFPNYEQIIPKNFDTEIVVGRDQFINAIKLVSTFTTKGSEVKIKVDGSEKAIHMYSSDSARGENTYVIPAKIKGKGVEVSFNWRFLIDGLRALNSEQVLFSVNNKEKPALLKSTEDNTYFYIAMPIKSQ